MIYKFVKWEVSPLKELKGSDIYNLYEKAQKGLLSMEDKDVIFKYLQTNSYSRTGIPRAGWMFSFKEHLEKYLVKLKEFGWEEVYSINKHSIQKFYGSSGLEIIKKPERFGHKNKFSNVSGGKNIDSEIEESQNKGLQR